MAAAKLMLSRILAKNLHTWLGGYARDQVRRARAARVAGPRHLMFALCDHYEPLWGDAPAEVGQGRVRAWREEYPRVVEGFRDADGFAPRHSFFFPGEQYAPEYMDSLAELTAGGYGEVEFHLHHDGDTSASVREKIDSSVRAFAEHGHFSRDPDGRPRYAFIHGDWALANARKSGRNCGVDNELEVLFDTGCYADFTFPSAPDACQPNVVNLVFWPMGDLHQARPYDRVEPARVGVFKEDRILMFCGPLSLAKRPGKLSVRIENGALTGVDPPSAARVASWAAQNIHIAGRPEWVFVKVFTHGAPEETLTSLLGDGSRALHRELTSKYNDGHEWVLHYVTAREMYNVARAALEGKRGDPGEYRDFALAPPPAAAAASR